MISLLQHVLFVLAAGDQSFIDFHGVAFAGQISALDQFNQGALFRDGFGRAIEDDFHVWQAAKK